MPQPTQVPSDVFLSLPLARYSTATTTPYSVAYLLSLLAFIIGNFAQSTATKPAGLLLARALIGMSSGNVAVGSAHLTRELKNGDERNAVVALFTGTEMLVSPCLASPPAAHTRTPPEAGRCPGRPVPKADAKACFIDLDASGFAMVAVPGCYRVTSRAQL